MSCFSIVSLDIGGTTINAGRYKNGVIEENYLANFSANESESQILSFIIACIERVKLSDTKAIAIGVPCIVDVEQGEVFDAVNIPAWQRYALKSALQRHYQLDVYINNDVNCFIAGEYSHGVAANYRDAVGICLGTGFGSGFVLNKCLHVGHNCCAGEVGGIPYLDGTIDDYCSGQFFINQYQRTGAELSLMAEAGDKESLIAFQQFGHHLANAICHLLFVIDPQIIVLGGSVTNAYHLFIDAVWETLETFPYRSVITNLKIVKSELPNAALLGAAYLYQQSKT